MQLQSVTETQKERKKTHDLAYQVSLFQVSKVSYKTDPTNYTKDSAGSSKTYTTGLQGCIGCLIFIRHFLQKSPIISGSHTGRDLQLKVSYASSPPCSSIERPKQETKETQDPALQLSFAQLLYKRDLSKYTRDLAGSSKTQQLLEALKRDKRDPALHFSCAEMKYTRNITNYIRNLEATKCYRGQTIFQETTVAAFENRPKTQHVSSLLQRLPNYYRGCLLKKCSSCI